MTTSPCASWEPQIRPIGFNIMMDTMSSTQSIGTVPTITNPRLKIQRMSRIGASQKRDLSLIVELI